MKYYIVGIHKCGTTSLEFYLKNQGHDVIRTPDAFFKLPYEKSDRKIAVILRDPIQRTWSHYNYKKYHQDNYSDKIECSFEEALTKHPEIINNSKYQQWLDKYPGAEVFHLEDMIKLAGFPRLTESKYMEELTPERYSMIKEALDI